jgi:pyridoxamine 5'-phosphate oxidase
VDPKAERMQRIEYERGRLHRKDLDPDPVKQFLRWYEDARQAGHRDPSAMSLSTVGADGAPHARMVLLKAADERGFIFCTHKNSPKGKELQANPRAALVFYWARSERQVRVEGVARWLSKEENAEFFSARPKGAQIAASLGHQSETIENREKLEALYKTASRRYDSVDVPPLENWGGFAIDPSVIEFWQGGIHRLHDRFRYTLHNGVWQIERLMP